MSEQDRKRLQEALKHEENAIEIYRRFAREADDARLQEMFEQFAMNEGWHAAALRTKLDASSGTDRT